MVNIIGEKMKDKKAQGLSLTTIIVAAIALIVLVVLVMIFTGRIGIFNEEFDSEKHICKQWAYAQGIYNIDWIEEFEKKENCIIISNNSETINVECTTRCIDWRNKNKCELNPNTEGCVCDEFEIPNIEYCNDLKRKRSLICDTVNSTNPYQIDIEWCNWKQYQIKQKCNTNNCIKAHKKTLEDLSCNALLSSLFYDSNLFRIEGDKLVTPTWCPDCEIKRDEIIKVVQEKGCLNTRCEVNKHGTFWTG